jgi:hypothetical protein
VIEDDHSSACAPGEGATKGNDAGDDVWWVCEEERNYDWVGVRAGKEKQGTLQSDQANVDCRSLRKCACQQRLLSRGVATGYKRQSCQRVAVRA